jgi:hypothetical protein
MYTYVVASVALLGLPVFSFFDGFNLLGREVPFSGGDQSSGGKRLSTVGWLE